MSKSLKQLLLASFCCGLLVMQLTAGPAGNWNAEQTAFAYTEAVQVQVPAPVLSPTIPPSVASVSTAPTPTLARPFFDYFSWQCFVALNWPAQMQNGIPVRGQANPSANIGDAGIRVWETYKADWELFRPGGAQPTPWSSWAVNPAGVTPCNSSPGTKTFSMISKMDSVIDGFNQAFSGPLIDQNRNYTRYEVTLNQSFYETAVSQMWYLRAKLSTDPNNPNVFPWGVLETKASWRELTPADAPSRYYTVVANIVEPNASGTPTCRPAVMGLVGLHIGYKVSGFREWVWATFEQVDNVRAPGSVPVSYNNGTSTPQTTNGFDWPPGDNPVPGCPYPQGCTVTAGSHNPPCKICDNQSLPPRDSCLRTPVQVTRLTPISYSNQATPTTDTINAQWQQALKNQNANSVWQYYQLVIVQWPSNPDGSGKDFAAKGATAPVPPVPAPSGPAAYPFNCDTPFPDATKFGGTIPGVANVTMETYLQNNNSCMQCHYGASTDDFSFIMSQRAWPPPPPQPGSQCGPPATASAAKRRKVKLSPTLQFMYNEMSKP